MVVLNCLDIILHGSLGTPRATPIPSFLDISHSPRSITILRHTQLPLPPSVWNFPIHSSTKINVGGSYTSGSNVGGISGTF